MENDVQTREQTHALWLQLALPDVGLASCCFSRRAKTPPRQVDANCGLGKADPNPRPRPVLSRIPKAG